MQGSSSAWERVSDFCRARGLRWFCCFVPSGSLWWIFQSNHNGEQLELWYCVRRQLKNIDVRRSDEAEDQSLRTGSRSEMQFGVLSPPIGRRRSSIYPTQTRGPLRSNTEAFWGSLALVEETVQFVDIRGRVINCPAFLDSLSCRGSIGYNMGPSLLKNCLGSSPVPRGIVSISPACISPSREYTDFVTVVCLAIDWLTGRLRIGWDSGLQPLQ
jgi:hypothetical protein